MITLSRDQILRMLPDDADGITQLISFIGDHSPTVSDRDLASYILSQRPDNFPRFNGGLA